MLRSSVEKARAGSNAQTAPYRATQVKQMLEVIEGYDAAIAEAEGKLHYLDARVQSTRERFGRARATLEEERDRIGNDLATLEGDLAGVSALLKKKGSKIMDLRRRVVGTEHVLGLEDSGDAEMTDALAEAYVQTAEFLRDWREASGSRKELEERIDERQGELRDIAFQIEQLGTNQEENLARLEGTARGLRMLLREKEHERTRLCSGLVEKGPTLIRGP
jgi:chromosome segregation ATPase